MVHNKAISPCKSKFIEHVIMCTCSVQSSMPTLINSPRRRISYINSRERGSYYSQTYMPTFRTTNECCFNSSFSFFSLASLCFNYFNYCAVLLLMQIRITRHSIKFILHRFESFVFKTRAFTIINNRHINLIFVISLPIV